MAPSAFRVEPMGFRRSLRDLLPVLWDHSGSFLALSNSVPNSAKGDRIATTLATTI